MKYLHLSLWIGFFIFFSVQAKDKKENRLAVKDQSLSKNGQMICDTTITTLISSIEMISNGAGPFNRNYGFYFHDKPNDYKAFSASFFNDYQSGDMEKYHYPVGMQQRGGWFFVTGTELSTSYAQMEADWTYDGDNNERLAGNSYEIRFTEQGGKAYYAFDWGILVDVPFEIWYLGSTKDNGSDDVRMIPYIVDIANVDSVYSFQLDHAAHPDENDPYSDRTYFFMPLDNTPGEAGYNQFVSDATAGTYTPFNEDMHIGRLTIMSLDRHQDESDIFQSDGPVNALPETGTTFRINFYEQPKEKGYRCVTQTEANAWEMALGNDGSWGWDSRGFGTDFWPGSAWDGDFSIYKGGHFIGTLKEGIPTVSAAEWHSEFQPGPILNDSPAPLEQLQAADPDDEANRVYIIDEQRSGLDWEEWPVEWGAVDDGTGAPFLKSKEDSWVVYNDLDSLWHFGEEPLGLEVQRSTYSYTNSLLNDVVFFKWTVINMTDNVYSDTYFGIYMDVDVGDWENDLTGYDESRNMAYAYNANLEDAFFAVGIDLLSSPGNSTGIAAGFTSMDSGYNFYSDPQRYNALKGLTQGGAVRPGGPYDNNGDPVNETGALDPVVSDKKILLSVGPFDMQPGEKNEILAAVLGARSNFDNIEPISQLRLTSDYLQSFYDAGNFSTPVIEDISESQPALKSDFTVTTTIENDFSLNDIELHYAPGGSSEYSSLSMSLDGVQYKATIPANKMTADGVKYYIYVENSAGNWTVSDTNYVIVNIPNNNFSIVQSGGSKQNAYRMISVPYALDNPSIDNILVDDLGNYDPQIWRLFKDDGDNYLEYPNTGDLNPGDALWLITQSNETIYFPGGNSSLLQNPFPITLSPGWNQVALPFTFPVDWQDILNTSANPSLNGPYLYEDSYVSPLPTYLEPFKGYYIENLTQADIVLNIPPIASSASLPKTILQNSWQIMIKGQRDAAIDNLNIIGAMEEASNTIDQFDISEPPPVGEYLSIYFTNRDNLKQQRRLATDFREPNKDGYIWDIEVESNIRGEKTELRFYSSGGGSFEESLNKVPGAYEVILMDHQEIKQIDLRENPQYLIKNSVSNTKMTLLIGTESFVEENISKINPLPQKFKLGQNFPNPFNPTTTIEYALPKASNVSVVVYNMLGEKIKTLIADSNKDAGYYSIEWDGTNNYGKQVASGVYLYGIKAADFTKTKKMILIR